MTKTKDLKSIARKVLKLCSSDAPWNPTTADMRERFGLNDAQVKTVKDYAKTIASYEEGILWAWDPGVDGVGTGGGFRYCPTGESLVAKRMMAYANKGWRQTGKGMKTFVNAVREMGFISIDAMDASYDEINTAIKHIGESFNVLDFREDDAA